MASPLVIVVDDEALLLEALQLWLQEHGFEVLVATRGDEAIDLCREQTRWPDVILADYRLTDGSTGIDVIEAIRALHASPIPAVLLTGDTSPKCLEQVQSGEIQLLVKPIRPEQLVDAIRRVLRRPPASQI